MFSSVRDSRGFVMGNDENRSPRGAARHVSIAHMHENVSHTQLVLRKTVELHALRKFVGLAADDDRDRVPLGHHGDESCAGTGVHGTVGVY